MTGFGPYKNVNILDMESLGRGGLYLITGDTGAGKTYIFDAITYALYGEMSGSGRDSRSIRCQYSPDGEKTEVELVFEYRGHEYKVTRNPEYIRAKKSGEGFTRQTAGATLIRPDGSAVDGTSKVNEAIRNILGIDRDQFCSIAMIAQGEFRKVLNAGTDERQKLFRKLFNTLAYSRLSEELKELNKRNQEKYNDGIRSMNLILSSVSCSFDDTISSHLDALKERSENEAVMSDEICDLLVSVIDAGEKSSSAIENDLTKAEDRLTVLSNIIALARDHRSSMQKLGEAKGNIPVLDEKIALAEKALAEAGEKKPVAEKLEREDALTEASLSSYDELDAINAELAGYRKELEKKDSDHSAAEKEAETLKKQLDESESLLEELRSSGEDLIKTRNAIEKNRDRSDALGSLLKEIETVSGLEDKLKKQQEELEPLIADADRLAAEHSSMLSAYMREQAGILAGSLTDGEPCPVCGSVHHPDPADLSEDAPSPDDIEEMEKKLRNARDKASSKMTEAQTTKGNLSAVTERVRETAIRETGSDDLKTAKESASGEITSLKESAGALLKEEKELEEKAAKAAELKAALPGLRKSLDEAKAKAKDIEKEMNAVRTAVSASEAGFRQLRKDLAFDSRDEAERSLAEKSAEAKKLREEMEKAARDLNAAASEKKVNDAKIGELERVVAGHRPVDEEAAADEAAAVEAEKERLKERNIQIASELKTAEAALKSVRTGAAELEKIRKEHEVINSLSRTANGSVPGKERITLESYVQSFFFERIIRHANIRLKMMSDGQYEFVRSGEAGDKRHLSGLDLSVLDHYSGTERPVSTLSGGESFMASLSLALGLSDEVQASSGGIRLDTMFVDEGFGSLDSETLEKAIRTLTELAEDDKLVGIISHVDALKTRIDRQIVVTKDRDAGSRASVYI